MTDLITPSATSAAWLADAAGAAHAVVANLANWETAGWLGMVLGGVIALAGIAKFIHPLGALIGPAVEKLATLFMPKQMIEAKKTAKTMETTAWNIVEIIEALPPELEFVGELKKRISVAAPSEFHTIFDAWKKEREADIAKAKTAEVEAV